MKSNHRCVLYARTACDGLEPSNNTSNQLDMVRQYAQGIGLKIVGEYFDSGASGRYETFPPDLMQVMNLASERKIDAIVLRDPSRLYRGIEVCEIITWLEGHDVEVIALHDGP